MADTDEDGGAWPVQTVYDEVRGDGLAASRHIHRGEAVLRVAPLVAVPCSTSAARRCATCLAALGSTPGGAASSPCGHCGVAVLCGRCAAVGARGAALHGDECDAWALLARGLGPAGLGMGTPDVLLLLRLLLACRRHERGQLPPDHMAADADGEDIIADSFDAVGQLVSVEDVALVPATMAVLMEQAKATKLLAPAWARCSLEACLELASALQLNGMEITEAPKRRRRGLPARGHSAWAQGATIGMGLYPSAALLNHSCAPNCRLDFGDDGCLTVSATEDVGPGTELTITYIDTPFQPQRKAALI
eukprot:jgi/Tetstr1/427391/TSEL_017555.t1